MLSFRVLAFWFLLQKLSFSQDAPFFIHCIAENCTESNDLPCERTPPCSTLGDCKELPMNEALRFTITHLHNQIRATVATTAPGASKMRALKYNRDLEIIAQCWINTCTLEKTTCLMTPQYKTFGQNLGSMNLFNRPRVDPLNDPASLWQDIMNSWTKGMNEINTGMIQKLPPPEEMFPYGHYTQIVTDYTSELGCAWSFSNETIFYVCFYGPQGGIQDLPVYEFGPSCSKCPEGTHCYEPLGLCAPIHTGVQLWKMKLKNSEFPSGASDYSKWNFLIIFWVFHISVIYRQPLTSIS